MTITSYEVGRTYETRLVDAVLQAFIEFFSQELSQRTPAQATVAEEQLEALLTRPLEADEHQQKFVHLGDFTVEERKDVYMRVMLEVTTSKLSFSFKK